MIYLIIVMTNAFAGFNCVSHNAVRVELPIVPHFPKTQQHVIAHHSSEEDPVRSVKAMHDYIEKNRTNNISRRVSKFLFR